MLMNGYANKMMLCGIPIIMVDSIDGETMGPIVFRPIVPNFSIKIMPEQWEKRRVRRNNNEAKDGSSERKTD